MKAGKVLGALALCMMTFLAFGCGSSQGADKETAASQAVQSTESSKEDTAMNKSLVVYFSRSGNTEYAAQAIAQAAGADIFKIEPIDTRYEADYDTVVQLAKEEQQQGARPEIAGRLENISQYDTIYIGCPNWWSDMPMIMYTFLDSYDLSGKKIAPFVTNEGSGLSRIPESIQREEPDAHVVEGLAIRGSQVRSSDSAIRAWVEQVQAAK